MSFSFMTILFLILLNSLNTKFRYVRSGRIHKHRPTDPTDVFYMLNQIMIPPVGALNGDDFIFQEDRTFTHTTRTMQDFNKTTIFGLYHQMLRGKQPSNPKPRRLQNGEMK